MDIMAYTAILLFSTIMCTKEIWIHINSNSVCYDYLLIHACSNFALIKHD